jgi:hypothetical protein
MSCNCTRTLLKEYEVVFELTPPMLVITDRGVEVARCGGALNVTLPSGYDCARLTFEYRTATQLPQLTPLAVATSCPCEAQNDTTSAPQIYIGTFKPPAGSLCRYDWNNTLPGLVNQPCTITIVVSAPPTTDIADPNA